MGEINWTDERIGLAVGGGVLLGLGVGFFFLQKSALAFVGCLLGGIGLGLLVASVLSTLRRG